jgi:predicted PurR-regulated permease PerM
MMQQEKREFKLSTTQSIRLILLGAAALFLGLGSLLVVELFARTLAIVFLSITIAAALSPLVEQFAKRVPRNLAIVLVYLALILLLIGTVALIVPSLISQARNLTDRLPEVFNEVEGWIEQQGWINGDTLFDAAVSQIQSIGTDLLLFPVELFSALLDVTLVVIISLYMLLETEGIRRFGLSLFPRPQRQRVWDVATEMLEAAGGFVRGLALNILIIGVITYIGLSVIGVNYALVLGIISGLLEVIPVVGPLIAAVPAIAIALLDSPTTALITALFLFVVQQFEGNILTPNIMHSQAKVSPLLVLIAVFAGSAVGGVVGTLVAIPLVAALRVFVVRVIVPAIRSAGSTPSIVTEE